MGATPRERVTFQGDGKSFAAGLKGFAQKKGRLFCKYPCEVEQLAKSTLNIKSVYAHHDLLEVLKKMQTNLSFPKKVVRKGMEVLVKDLKDEFALKPEQVEDYINTTTKRIRCLGRVVMQGDSKNKHVGWVKDLPWNRAGDVEHEAEACEGKSSTKGKRGNTGKKGASGSEASSRNASSTSGAEASSLSLDVACANDLIYEFNEELVVCVRTPLDGGPQDISLPLSVPSSGSDADIVMATWASGDTHEVPGLTIGRLKEVLGRGSSVGDLWVATQKETKHKLTIKQRVDRCLLLSLFEQQRQILQLRMNLLGPVDDENRQLPKGHPTLEKALAIMVPLGTKFANSKMSKAELKLARDAEIKKVATTIVETSFKRPSCAIETQAKEGVTKGEVKANNEPKPNKAFKANKEPNQKNIEQAKVAKAELVAAAESSFQEPAESSEYEPMPAIKGSLFDLLY